MDRAAVLTAHLNSPPCLETLAASAVAGKEGLLQGQVAIITGSGQGIGAAAAKLFAQEGAKVVVTDLDEAKAASVASEIRAAGGQAVHLAGDVTDPAYPERLLKLTIEYGQRLVTKKAMKGVWRELFGLRETRGRRGMLSTRLRKFGKLNILVNNAGYTWDGVIHKTTDQQWEAMFKVHCTAPFRLIRAATPFLRDASKKEMEEGRTPENRVIINISSTSGIHGNAGQINYSTAKMGIVGMTKTVAKEWGPFGVRCNAIAFGYIETRLTQSKDKNESIEVEGKKIALGIPDQGRAQVAKAIPLGRSGRPEEAAGAILLLASPLSSYISGHTLEVTGGFGI